MIRNEWANAHPKISSMFTYKSVTLILQQNTFCQIFTQIRLVWSTPPPIVFGWKWGRKNYDARAKFFYLIYSSMKKIALVGICSVLFLAGCGQATPTKNLDEFAQCLTDKWAIMYGAVNCSHCQKQETAFGKSFTYITYVECTKEFDRCSKLKGTPTWEFSDGTMLEWYQELSVLAQKTACTLP